MKLALFSFVVVAGAATVLASSRSQPTLPAAVPQAAFHAGLPGLPRQPLVLQSGVYRSEPYTALVLVPSAGRGDKSVITPHNGARSNMPTLQPKLELVPR